MVDFRRPGQFSLSVMHVIMLYNIPFLLALVERCQKMAQCFQKPLQILYMYVALIDYLRTSQHS